MKILQYVVVETTPHDFFIEMGWLYFADAIQHVETNYGQNLLRYLMGLCYDRPGIWEGDISEGPFLKLTHAGPMIGFKQPNNGTTFIAYPKKLDWEEVKPHLDGSCDFVETIS